MNSIFNRLKLFHGLSSDIELAKLLGLNQTTLSMQRRRGTIDIQAVLRVSEQIDLNWLFKSKSDSIEPESTIQFATNDPGDYFKIDENQLIEEVLRLRKKVADLEFKLKNAQD